MLMETTVLRLFISQPFAVYYALVLIPLVKPQRNNALIIILGAFTITLLNAWVIVNIGLSFYIRFYFLTLTVPYIVLFYYFAFYKGAKLLFALLTVQVIGNVTILNGLFASYMIYGENAPFLDTMARVATYVIFLPIIYLYIRPTYLKMVEVINTGWWVLNSALIVSYVMAYYILFVPDTIFTRPVYFTHAYLGIALSLLIYVIILFLFIEIQTKNAIEHDKHKLSNQVTTILNCLPLRLKKQSKTTVKSSALQGMNSCVF